MQDVDRIAYVQQFALPPRHRRPRTEPKTLPSVPGPQELLRVFAYLGRRRDFGENSPVRASEYQRTIRLALEMIALLVHGAVVATAEQGEVRQRRGPTVRPVTDVMSLNKAD